MPAMCATETNVFSTRDWMNVSRDLKLSAYDPTAQQDSESSSTEKSSAIFGTHIREAIAIIKDWKADQK